MGDKPSSLPDWVLAENQRIADEIGRKYYVDLCKAFGVPAKPTFGLPAKPESGDGESGEAQARLPTGEPRTADEDGTTK